MFSVCDKIWTNKRWRVCAFVWVGLYIILFHRWQYPPVLNAEPRMHPCNEVLMWVHSVPEEQASSRTVSSQRLLPSLCDRKKQHCRNRVTRKGRNMHLCGISYLCCLKTTGMTHSPELQWPAETADTVTTGRNVSSRKSHFIYWKKLHIGPLIISIIGQHNSNSTVQQYCYMHCQINKG